MADSVNPLVAGWQIWRAMRATPPPRPAGTATADHGGLAPVLDALRRGGIEGFDRQDLRDYLDYASSVDPDALSRDHALAYWVNHYNAHAIDLARSALDEGKASVLAFDSAFTADVARVAGDGFSLNAIEHGKIRRFGNPLIHAALVCGSISCPTLRHEPFTGHNIAAELEEQMRWFLANGGAVVTGDTLHLSRVFAWYSGDFVRGTPSWLPARKVRVVEALSPWLPSGAADAGTVSYMAYDWGLGCAVR